MGSTIRASNHTSQLLARVYLSRTSGVDSIPWQLHGATSLGSFVITDALLCGKPDYEALSDVSGDATITSPTQLLPTHIYSLLWSTNFEFHATTNVEYALCHLR